ncbi:MULTISPECIES: hypothetical protein [Cyanophyceae]|uniref:hypothetical protein n=1 Tax=Cyanophyceae TaxID=3028117 RepID=UPI001684BE1B|nr:hypothetical protein [Trichocoleus sp. FACHB-40]MBD2004568.1 hypothetical protein [Trichocoleus sp. FACHB-40]
MVATTTPIKEDTKVVATGLLRPFVVVDIKKEDDLTWDLELRRKLEVEYKNKPVLVVKDVYPAAPVTP